jgi:hypothetical protein
LINAEEVGITPDDLAIIKATVRGYLMSQRLTNYGYDYKDFRNMSNEATKLRKMFQCIHFTQLSTCRIDKTAGILDRLQIQWDNARHVWSVFYIVGQSFNEEYVNLLKVFTRKG